jgi:hypothetical protein
MERRTNMKHVGNCKLKRVFICLFCLGFLLIFSVPAMAAEFNLASSRGSALIDWGQAGVVFSLTNGAVIKFLENNSFSSAWAGVNGKDTDPGQSDFFEDVPNDPVANPPHWWGTAFTAKFLGKSGSAVGNADTAYPPTPVPVDPTIPLMPANRNFAASSVNLTRFGDADVFVAQAVLEGPFTVSDDCTLTVTVPYTLMQDLSSSLGSAAFSDAAVSLTVYDLNSYDPKTGNSVILPGSVSVSSLKNLRALLKNPPAITKNGNLTLSVNLIANYPGVVDGSGNPVPIVYDFEAAASTIASAWFPPIPRIIPALWWWLSRVRGEGE